ncbi:MAG: primase-helicase family protein, partial [Alloacidobacterium sp.]
DISHVWRVPGALNWPNSKKVAAGRPRDPQLVRVEMYSGSTTSLQALSDALPEAEVSSERKKSSTRSKPAGARPTSTDDPETPKGNAHSPHRGAVAGSPENLAAIARLQSLSPELQEDIKRPVPRGHRSEAIFKVIAKMLEEGLDDNTIENIIRAHPTGIGEKYADRDDLNEEIARVRQKTAAPSQGDTIESIVIEMNREYAVVDDNGKTVVIYRREDTDLDRKYIVRSSYQDFRNIHLNTRVLVPIPSGRPKSMTHADIWLNHPQRKTYRGGLRFLPGTYEGPSDVYNLWTGWGVDPQPGDWPKMKAHIHEVLCSGSAEYFDYVMNWLARAVQKPGEAGEVALVLRGARGTGKGMFARTFGALFGQHFLHLSDARHLTGNFNAHLRDSCLVFADEAFYAGDKQHEGQLKRLVTEPTLMIEAKYANAVSVRNCLHLIVASNDDWVVPAGTDERRFFVLDVSSARQKDYEYFGSLEKELEQGGATAMLHELLHRDLSGFNVRDVPQTSGLSDQKIRSLRGFEAWWFEALDEGKIAGIVSDDGLFTDVEEHWSEEIKVNRDILYNDYVDFSKERKEYRREDKSRLGKFLRKYVPGLTEERPRQPGTRHRDRLYRLPPLNTCRADFEKVIGSVEWENT